MISLRWRAVEIKSICIGSDDQLFGGPEGTTQESALVINQTLR